MSSGSNFSFHTFTSGNIGTSEPAPRGSDAAAAQEQTDPASSGFSSPGVDPRDPTVETLPSGWLDRSGAWETGRSRASLPSVPAVRAVVPGPAPESSGPEPSLDQALIQALVPSTAAPLLVPSPSWRELEPFPGPVTDEASQGAAPRLSEAPAEGKAHQRQRWQRWDMAVGTLVLLVLGYVLLAGVLYALRLWEARQTNSVTIVQDIGHGGLSQVTVTFEHNQLMVVEIDNDDPTRVTILRVNEAIVLGTDKTVVEVWFQAVLQPGRLDLVIQLDGGLDWPPYHPQFTTILINNVAAIRKDPQAPGLRAPTAQELQQALRTLGT